MKKFPYTDKICSFNTESIKNGNFKNQNYFFESCDRCSTVNKIYSIYCRYCGYKLEINLCTNNSIEVYKISKALDFLDLNDLLGNYLFIELMDYVLIINDLDILVIYSESDFKIREFSAKFISQDKITNVSTDYKYIYFHTEYYIIKLPAYIFTVDPDNIDFSFEMMNLFINKKDKSTLNKLNKIYNDFIKKSVLNQKIIINPNSKREDFL